MKKNLLILAFAAPLLAFGQKPAFFMGDGVSVKVQKQTLVYTNGEFKVKEGATSATSNKNKFSNDGNVKVNGNFTTEDNGNQSTRFVNRFTSGTEYGQLIIKGGTTNGKITGEYKFVSATTFAYQPIAFPFDEYTAGEAATQSGMTNPVWYPKQRSENRYKSPVFTVENTKSQSVNDAADDPLSPIGSHSINQSLVTKTGTHSFIGKPASGSHPVLFPTFTVTKKNSEFNDYGEFIGGNVVDITRTAPSGWAQFRTVKGVSAGDYGANLYSLGNPYTSNLDLSKLPTTVQTVIVYKSAEFQSNFSDNPTGLVAEVEINTPSGLAGDNRVIVRPYQVFDVKTSGGLNFQFGNNFKTFDVTTSTPTFTYSKTKSSNSGLYQVGLDLYSGEVNTENRVYVVASDIYKDQGNSEYEAYNLWLGNNVGFYTLQEKADGTVAEDLSNQKVYVNGINSSDYVAKPIHLVFQGKNNTPYTLKARLNEALLNSKNTFYFEDKKEGKVMEITPDFEYTFVEPTLNKDRFVIYWNGLPETMSTQEVGTATQTRVYKDGDSYKVRFATEFNRADVYVYDLSGRLISSEKSVDASVDHTLPYLSNGKVFIVKVVGDNGAVTSQKIIK